MSRLMGIRHGPAYYGLNNPGNTIIENNHVEGMAVKYKFRPSLTNGQVWEGKGKMPTANELFGYPEKWYNGFPLSKTSEETGFASNPETIIMPNPDAGFKLGDDFKDSYNIANRQREKAMVYAFKPENIAVEAVTENLNEILESIQDQRDSAKHEHVIKSLKDKGFTDEEIKEYIKEKRKRDIEYAVIEASRPDAVKYGLEDLLHTSTGLNAESYTEDLPVAEKYGMRSEIAVIKHVGAKKREMDVMSVGTEPKPLEPKLKGTQKKLAQAAVGSLTMEDYLGKK